MISSPVGAASENVLFTSLLLMNEKTAFFIDLAKTAEFPKFLVLLGCPKIRFVDPRTIAKK